MNFLNVLFHDFDFVHFPWEACDRIAPLRNPEPGIMVGDPDTWYLCVCIDHRWPDQVELRQLQPYTAANLPECINEGEPPILCGWCDHDGVWDHHGPYGIHNDNSRVVAWKKLPRRIKDLRDNLV